MNEPIKHKALDVSKSGKRTQAEEQKLIEYELVVVRRKFAKLNKELNHFQVTNCEIEYSEKKLSPIDLHFQFGKRLKKWFLKKRDKNLNK